MITKNKVVTVSYELKTQPEGDILETADAARPLEFICGQGQTLEYFEMNLLNLNAGDKFDFKVPSANAYGDISQDMIIDLPRDIFKEVEAEDLTVGNMLPMMDSMGRHLEGKILEINEEEVKIDFNHPLAGGDLYFKGEILGVRDATDAEIEALNSHSCGCGSCGTSDGCGDGCSSEEGGCGCGGGCGH